MARLFLWALVLVMLLASSEGQQPRTRKPKRVRCKNKKFPSCLNKDLYCPATCPRDCFVDCSSCQSSCTPPPPPPPPSRRVRCRDRSYRKTCNTQLLCPATCPRTCTVDCASCQPICGQPSALSPPPPPVVASPSPPPPPVVATPNLQPPDSSEAAGGKRVRCKIKSYTDCYYREHRCPADCPGACEVDCVKCSPVCDCNVPGAICQDPRFIGADGITFYFHGKKDKDFCIVSDKNLHINAHFIGRRNQEMGRDFTWVQSLGILFENHQILVSAKKTATWHDAVDRLELSHNGAPISLPEQEGAKWEKNSNTSSPRITITRPRDTNAVVIKVEGSFQIKASVVPITEKDSRIHKYGITDEDCFAHLDLAFKFYSLTGNVSGILGQTYATGYTSRAKMGVDMPVLGGQREFASSSLVSTDCAAARFEGARLSSSNDHAYV